MHACIYDKNFWINAFEIFGPSCLKKKTKIYVKCHLISYIVDTIYLRTLDNPLSE